MPLLKEDIVRKLIMDNVVVNESILFQVNSQLFKELILSFKALQKEAKDKISDSELVTNISKIIKHHTGLNVTLNIANNNPQVTIPMVNKNNVLVNSVIRNVVNSSDGLKLIAESKGAAKGSVNLKTGEVSGIFSEVSSTIDMPIYMFTTMQFTPEEISAIALHEIGHLVVYYEYMSRTVSTNQALAGVSKALDKSGTVEEREAVLITAKTALGLKDLDAKLLAKSNNKKVAEIVIITNIVKETVSELGCNIYDLSTWEYLADQYAARHGAGRYLATGLEKVYNSIGNISFRSTPTYLAMEALKVFLIISPIIVLTITGSMFISPLSLSIVLMMLDSDNPTYDRPGERIKRIRDQIVENLKDKKLDKDDIERLNADIAAIDIILKEVDDRRQFISVLWDIVSSTSRKARNQESLQKELEDLIVNDLFVMASKLKIAA